ncbi:STAS domain-containing protein [Actinophytocola sp. KF-1]
MTDASAFTWTWARPDARTGCVTLSGDLVHRNAEQLLGAVGERLAAHDELRELRIDCAGLDVCDSRGLSVLLMIRRRTESLGIAMSVVNRTTMLDRLMERTGTAEYLTGESR